MTWLKTDGLKWEKTDKEARDDETFNVGKEYESSSPDKGGLEA